MVSQKKAEEILKVTICPYCDSLLETLEAEIGEEKRKIWKCPNCPYFRIRAIK